MRRVVAIAIPIVSVSLLLVSGVLNAWAGRSVTDPIIWLPLSLACATVGSLLILRRAGGVLGPLFAFVGLQIPLGSSVQAYAYAAIEHGLRGAAWGAWFFQAAKVGSNALQCGQLYQKNSTTSTLPAPALVGAGLASLM